MITSAYRFRVFTGTDDRNDCHCIPFFFFKKPDTKKELKIKSFQPDTKEELKFKSLQSVAPKVQHKKTTSAKLYPMRYYSWNRL